MEQPNENDIASLIQIPEAEFRVPVSDDHGHTTRITLRVLPGHATAIHQILESKWFSYTSTLQIYRHAIKRHLEWLATLAPIPNSIIHRTNAIMEIMYEEEQQEKFMEIIEGMSRQVGRLLGEGSVEQAKEYVNRTYQEIDKMPECLWKKQFIKKMNEKYGYLLNEHNKKEIAKVVASLLELGDED